MRYRADELDLTIVRQMVLANADSPRTDRATVEEIGKTLGVHPNTVALRIRRMSEAQALLPLTLQVQAPVVGLAMAHVFFPIPPERRTADLVAFFRRARGLQTFIRYVEGWTCCLYGRDEADIAKVVRQLEAVCVVSATWDLIASKDFPPSEALPIDDLDARIIGALLADARQGLPELSRKLGVPGRTVRRRHARLLDRKAIRYIPGGSSLPSGIVLGYIHFDLPENRKQSAMEGIRRAVTEFWTGRFMLKRGHFWLYGNDVAGIAAQGERARQVDGVTNVRVRIMEHFETLASVAPTMVDLLTARATKSADKL
jgi:DNA-binding Lrp family transcriptional regulator